ncbi:hypothetical protein DRW41_12640 [Neobacillus piezotolerans]|uniref:YpoC-like domain-containing protein n=1 Tax=Neobacillus piezotolerans TaxID=2259171 RepID=A0A3D8GQC6_9BACI|nr:hypothetical protein [Neobacillus piezotolerans]RDU36379.1 hypothetical protein DRW41_12640 [Neobacillus piezotolerans]
MELHVPFALDHPFFHELIKSPLVITADITLFSNEISHYSGRGGKRPWNEPRQSVQSLYSGWVGLEEEISEAFKKRDKSAIRASMRKGTGLFLHLLFWSNGQAVTLARFPDISGLTVKPANCGERIQFLVDRPELFHSFIQLRELMDEQYKHFLVNLTKKK